MYNEKTLKVASVHTFTTLLLLSLMIGYFKYPLLIKSVLLLIKLIKQLMQDFACKGVFFTCWYCYLLGSEYFSSH